MTRRPCGHREPAVQPTYDYSQCFVCWQSIYSPPHAAIWGDAEGADPPKAEPRSVAAALSCRSRRELLRADECETCQGKWQIKVFRCAHPDRQLPTSGNGETTAANCQACGLWALPAP